MDMNTGYGCLRGAVGMIDTQIRGVVGIVDIRMKGAVGILDTSIKGKVGIICTPNTEVYLRIDPKVLWFFSEGETHSVDVVSNTRWTVKL